MKPGSPFAAPLGATSRLRRSAFLGKYQGQQKIAHWIQILKNDALRLQHFEKDDLVLVLGAIRGVPEETPMARGSGSKGAAFSASTADSCQPRLAIGHGTSRPGGDRLCQNVESGGAGGKV